MVGEAGIETAELSMRERYFCDLADSVKSFHGDVYRDDEVGLGWTERRAHLGKVCCFSVKQKL